MESPGKSPRAGAAPPGGRLMPALFLVYFGTAATAIVLASRKVTRLSPSASIVLVLLPLVLTGRALATGGYFGPLNMAYASAPLAGTSPEIARAKIDDGPLSDLQIQILPWRKAVRESVKHGRAPLLNRFILSGDPLLASLQPAPLHPGTFLGFLLPLATAWTFNGMLTFFLTALFTFLLARELGVSETAALFSAAVAMLAGFFVFWCEWPLAAAMAPFPLLAVGLRRVAREERGGFGISLTALLLLLFAGHPESVLHVTAAAGVVFAVELVLRRRSPAAPLGRAVAAGVSALALASPTLLPFAQIYPDTFTKIMRGLYAHERKSIPPRDVLHSAVAAVFPGVYGSMWNPAVRPPGRFVDVVGLFVGGLALFLACLGAFSSRRGARVFTALGVLSFAVAVGVPVVADAVSKLPLFDITINSRLVAVSVLCLSVLAGIGLDEASARGRPAAARAVAFSALVLVVGLHERGRVRELRLPTASFDASILLMVLPPAAFAVAALAARGRARVLSGVAIALFLPTHLAEMPRLYPTFPSRLFYPPVPELDALPRADEPYRTTALGYDLVPNQSALYGLEDVRGYQAVENARSASTYSLWCVPQPVWFNRIDDLTKPFLSFLNVRFAIAGPGQAVPAGWRELRRGPRCAVFENPAALPRAFAPESVRFVPDPSKTVELMRSCRDFSKVAWIEDSARPEGEAPNGRARVTATARGADLDVHVDAQSRSWIVVSQTAWRGWEAREGARLLPLRFANQAFLAFEVGPGRHEVRLEYRPRSFRLGVGLALASAAALVAVGILGRRRARTRIAPNAPAI